jgi:hypothetical protein
MQSMPSYITVASGYPKSYLLLNLVECMPLNKLEISISRSAELQNFFQA